MLKKVVTLYWDLKIERLTLGGALVLRQEGELLAAMTNQSSIDLYIDHGALTQSLPEKIIHNVFDSSSFQFIFHKGKPESKEYWPSESMLSDENFSYYSFSRLTQLYQQGLKPVRLAWKKEIADEARKIRGQFKKKLICVHMKRVAPFDVKESNADLDEWLWFLQNNDQDVDFIIIGDDPLPPVFEDIANVIPASALNMELSLQLALVSYSDGFIGMASGICNSANFSKTPHVLFKHPEHHIDDMQRELGDRESFIFSTNRQLLWRKEATAKKLQDALAFITQ